MLHVQNYGRKHVNLFYIPTNIKPLADEYVPSKLAKVEIPTSQLGGGAVPGTLGIGVPPQPALGAMPPVYVFRILF